MGLDMYLEKAKIGAEKYFKTDWEELKVTNKQEFNNEVLPLLYNDGGRQCLTKEIYYWRKSSAIHKWFSNQTEHGLGNCETLEVTKEMLQDFIFILEEVIKCKNGEEKLPTTSGFFFGSMEYDEWYYEDLKRTLTKFKSLIDSFDFGKEKIYYHGWW